MLARPPIKTVLQSHDECRVLISVKNFMTNWVLKHNDLKRCPERPSYAQKRVKIPEFEIQCPLNWLQGYSW